MSTAAADDRLPHLFAQIVAAPDDDDARLVYADALLERGDPRGELIMLQVARASGRGTLTLRCGDRPADAYQALCANASPYRTCGVTRAHSRRDARGIALG